MTNRSTRMPKQHKPKAHRPVTGHRATKHAPTLWGQLRERPLLVSSGLLGLCVALLAHSLSSMHAVTAGIIGWNAGALLYIALASWMMMRSTQEALRERAMRLDAGQGVVLVMVVLAALVSLAAILAELVVAKDLSGANRYIHIALAVLTILSSWAYTHLMFALHYAHDYHLALMRGEDGGLGFPGTEAPDYGDFLYLAFIVGTSGQTADVSFTSRHMRRIGLLHSVLAFLFNTSLLALTINIAASLF
jgi:uncharacterized membrane protein